MSPLRAVAAAQQSSGAGQWAQAAALWQQVVQANPVNGSYWDYLAEARDEPWIAPDIYVPPTFEAYRSNRDPAMEAILACREQLPG